MLLIPDDLWRHIHLGANHGVKFPGIPPGVFAQAKVNHLGITVLVNHDVLRLQVSVSDAARVDVR